jgi:hypothetical protein
MSTKEYPIAESKAYPTGTQISAKLQEEKETLITTPKKKFPSGATIKKRIEATHLKEQIAKMNLQKTTKKNHSLYPLIIPEDKSPIRARVRNCDYHRLPLKVTNSIASIQRVHNLTCTHIIEYSTGVYEINLNNGASFAVNVNRNAAGKKTRRQKKKKSRRTR